MADKLSNHRLKRVEEGIRPIDDIDGYVTVDGMWTPESSDPKKSLIFEEQVRITCDKSQNICQELTVTIAPSGGMVLIMSPEEKDWPIISWDARGLIASYGPQKSKYPKSEWCHSHILTMNFASGAVSTSDIPTHEKGCEEFPETDSYRLIRGSYYIDTTPGNDMDKPHPK
jgi:hypothetical protein